MDKLLNARIQDKLKEAERGYKVSGIGFLTPGEQTDIKFCIPQEFEYIFDGGYDEAERTFLFIKPRDAYLDFEDERQLFFGACRMASYKSEKELGHRDYLGALIGAGLKRESVGDILVYQDGAMQYADVILASGVISEVFRQIEKIGRVGVRVQPIPLSDLHIPIKTFREISDTVMSLRLDAVLSAGFGLSRADTKTAIERGMVQRNYREELSAGCRIEEGDILSMRGQGKIVLDKVLGETKKQRIRIQIKRYI